MHRVARALTVALALVMLGAQAPETKPITKPTTKPATTLPVVAKWKAREFPKDQVNLIAMGDWGTGDEKQKTVALTMAQYVERQRVQFNGAILAGDNFYVKMSGVQDYQWQTLFEDMYDAEKLNFPFYAVLGNHDFEGEKAKIELQYTHLNPHSRWKMYARWYRVDFPDEKPLVSVLMLDSNKPKMSEAQWQQQMRWIDEQLADRQGARWLVAMSHHPIFSNGSHGDNGVLMSQWGPIFQKHKLDFMVVGHDHDLQHLQIGGWHPTFLLCGGGGKSTRDMRRNNRGPFSRKLLGFAHMQFSAEQAEVRFVDARWGTVAHHFKRDKGGKVTLIKDGGLDKATTRPIRHLQGLDVDDR